MDQFTQIFSEATASLSAEYFCLPIDGADPVYRERVYCYELYHQMRKRWPNQSPYRLNGEPDKAAHPYFQVDAAPKPDFLVHQPGTSENYAVIEVKHWPINLEAMKKDVQILSVFKNRLHYSRAIYLVYGAQQDLIIDRIRECSQNILDISHLELWCHSLVSQPAIKV